MLLHAPSRSSSHLPNDAGALFCVGVLLHRFAENQLFLSPNEKHWLAQHPELHLGVIASCLPFEAPPLEREGCALENE